jgi:hypothetical protein
MGSVRDSGLQSGTSISIDECFYVNTQFLVAKDSAFDIQQWQQSVLLMTGKCQIDADQNGQYLCLISPANKNSLTPQNFLRMSGAKEFSGHIQDRRLTRRTIIKAATCISLLMSVMEQMTLPTLACVTQLFLVSRSTQLCQYTVCIFKTYGLLPQFGTPKMEV